MRANSVGLIVLNGALLLGGLGWLAWQQHVASELRAELAPLRAQREEIARLRTETARLSGRRVGEAELKTLRADHETLGRLRAELAKLKQEADKRVEHPVAKKLDDRAPEGPLRPAGEWRELGRETPAGTFESVLAAARIKKVEAIMPLLLIPGDGWNAIKAAMDGQPAAVRAANWPPARFVANALVQELQLDDFQVLASNQRSKEVVGLLVRLGHGRAEPAEINFNLYQQPAGWQLIVNNDAVMHYLERFKAAQAQEGEVGK